MDLSSNMDVQSIGMMALETGMVPKYNKKVLDKKSKCTLLKPVKNVMDLDNFFKRKGFDDLVGKFKKYPDRFWKLVEDTGKPFEIKKPVKALQLDSQLLTVKDGEPRVIETKNTFLGCGVMDDKDMFFCTFKDATPLSCEGQMDVLESEEYSGVPVTDFLPAEIFIDDAIKRNEQNPDTFWIPSEEQIDSLGKGDFAKMIFCHVDDSDRGCERMWVEITGKKEKEFVGKLDNYPVTVDMEYRDDVTFEKKHVINVMKKEELEKTKIKSDDPDPTVCVVEGTNEPGIPPEYIA